MSKIKIATVCTGIGSPEFAFRKLVPNHEIVFGCEIDKFARMSYEANFSAKQMFEDMTKESWDNPDLDSDLFVGGIPCQAFSLAGKRLGELDPRGLLFFDFYRYVDKRRPKAFIIENVKGLLSDNGGKTFENWLLLLGNSVNHHMQMFGHPDSLGYNLHWKVLNTKDFGLPQNRERVFLVGIRPDLPNDFHFPKGFRLTTRLRDVLEPVVDEKYYLSDKGIASITAPFRLKKKFTQIDGEIASTLTAKGNANWTGDFISEEMQQSVFVSKEVRTEAAKAQRRATGTNDFRRKEIVFEESEVINCIPTTLTNDHFIAEPLLIKEGTKKGFTEAYDGDSVNLNVPTSETRRGRVGDQIANTITTQPVMGVVLKQVGSLYENNSDAGRIYDVDGLAKSIKSTDGGGGAATGLYLVDDKIDEINNHDGFTQFGNSQDMKLSPLNGVSQTISAGHFNQPKIIEGGGKLNYRIRRLTPLECFRLQGFSDEFFYKAKFESLEKSKAFLADKPNHNLKRIFNDEERIERMSDSQLYKQAGNSISTTVIEAIEEKLLKILV